MLVVHACVCTHRLWTPCPHLFTNQSVGWASASTCRASVSPPRECRCRQCLVHGQPCREHAVLSPGFTLGPGELVCLSLFSDPGQWASECPPSSSHGGREGLPGGHPPHAACMGHTQKHSTHVRKQTLKVTRKTVAETPPLESTSAGPLAPAATSPRGPSVSPSVSTFAAGPAGLPVLLWQQRGHSPWATACLGLPDNCLACFHSFT